MDEPLDRLHQRNQGADEERKHDPETGEPLNFNHLPHYADPRLDPQHVLQEFKKHPLVAKLLDGGPMVRHGAQSFPYGGRVANPPIDWSKPHMVMGERAAYEKLMAMPDELVTARLSQNVPPVQVEELQTTG